MTKLIHALEAIVGQKNILQDAQAKNYARIDQSTNVSACLPQIIVLVNSRDELIRVTQACINFRAPLVIRGAGTGKSGGAVAQEHWVLIDISKLNKIIHLDKENLTADVEPGVILGDLQNRVKEQGLFYPPDPASYETCTLGGNVAENAGGPSTLKYGCTREYLLGGQAVIGTGEVINFGKRCPKGVAGYDIASLLCGSEGTLAVFTQFTLRLLPWPKDQAQSLFLFESEEEALLSVTKIFSDGHRPRILEYIDNICLRALQKQKLINIKNVASKAALLIECDASFVGGARLQLDEIKNILNNNSCDIINDDFKYIRSQLSSACSKYLGLKLSEDIAIPLAQLNNFRRWFKAQSSSALQCALFGHVGDGNLHVQILFEKEEYKDLAQDLRHQVLLRILNLGGTLTAEHGIGLQKVAYLSLEQSSELINLQKRIKEAFDPYNLLNPGKIFAI